MGFDDLWLEVAIEQNEKVGKKTTKVKAEELDEETKLRDTVDDNSSYDQPGDDLRLGK